MRSKSNLISEDFAFKNNIEENKFSQRTAWGIAVTGGMIYNGISGEGEDPFYPTHAAAAERMDTCMMHPANEVLHYHAAGSCAADTSTSQWELKNEKIELQSIVKESRQKRPYREVFGLSFDGRPIYSPYYNNEALRGVRC